MRKPAFCICENKGADQLDSNHADDECFCISTYRKTPQFSDTRKLCCNLPKIQTKRPKLRVFYQNDANGIANSEDPDQTAPLGAF